MLPQYAFMACARKQLPFGLSFIPNMFRNLVKKKKKIIDFLQTFQEQFFPQNYYVLRKVTKYRLLV